MYFGFSSCEISSEFHKSPREILRVAAIEFHHTIPFCHVIKFHSR
nr:MAG TPA: hypothetical protein [Caudoviricetes sp.]